MNLINTIKNLFRKGGAALGVVQSLGQITDHPKISVDPKEYDRIALDKRYFEGKFRKIEFRNTYGDLKRGLMSL
ncbi:hypothetical protein RNZ42_11340 [Lacticaseibacillus paracasei]|nr:hypothetical protein RNZ42_11340 [Lacticaseibacillus paracasei]